MVADPRYAVFLLTGPVDGNAFAHRIAVANLDAYRAFLDQYWPGQRQVDPSEGDYALVAICVGEDAFDQYLEYIELTPYVNHQAIGAAVTLEP